MNRFLLCLCAVLMTVFTAWADEVSFTGSAPSTVAVGQQFQLEYTVTTNNATAKDFRCSVGDGFTVLAGPTSGTMSRTSIINGKRTSSISSTFTYYVQAAKEGSFTIAAASVKVDGKTYTSNAVAIKVLPADKAAAASGSASGRNAAGSTKGAGIGKDDVVLNLELSKPKAYEGEAILATLKLYFRNHNVVSLSDAKLPTFEGFTVQEIDLPQAQPELERYKDANYQMVRLKQYLIFPQRSGELKIEPSSVVAVAQVVVSRRGGGFFFDMPFDQTQNVEVPVSTSAKTVNVLPLPSGKPASYLGGVGIFNFKTSLSTDHAKSNEAITYKIEIEGIGNLKYVKNPEPAFPADFEVYDPKVDINTKNTTSGVSGKKTIEYTLVPRYAGTFEIPALDFSYFDVKSGQYKTVSSPAYTLNVEKGADGAVASPSGNIADFSGTNREALKHLGNDIRYIHQLDMKSLAPVSAPFFKTLAYWMFFILPFLVFIIIAFIYRRQLKLNADLSLKQMKKANKVAAKRLKEAKKALEAKDEAAFYESVHKAMLGYVCDKLSIPMSELNRDNVEQQLMGHSVSEALSKQYMDVLSTCEFARYAPSHDDKAMDTLYQQAAKTINGLEDAIKR